MNIEQLRYFVTTLDEQSFSGAARALSVTTQCISKAVGNLEKELGALLIERSGQGARPTVFGYALAQQARVALRTFDDAADFAREYTATHRSEAHAERILRILICAPYFEKINYVSTKISELIEKRLGFFTNVSFCTCQASFDLLENGWVDMAVIIGENNDSRLSLSYLGHIPCGIQVAQENPLSHKQNLLIEDILPYPVYLWPGYDFFNHYVLCYFAAHHIAKELSENPRSLYFSPHTRKDIIIIPYLTSLDSTFYGTVSRPFDGSQKFAAPIYLATLKDSPSLIGKVSQEKIRKMIFDMLNF